MSTTPKNLDLHLGDAVLPSQIRRVTSDHRGALCFVVECEDHDRGLLRSLAAAVRDEPGTVERLVDYADVMDGLDAAEREGNYPLARSYEDDRDDAEAAIEANLTWQSIGEQHVAVLRPFESDRLVEALTGQPAEQSVASTAEGSAA